MIPEEVFISGTWRKTTGIGLTDEWQFVKGEEIVASITNYDSGEWRVWVRGAAHGTFTSLDAAKRRAEQRS